MRKHRRDRVLNSRAQLARISSSIGYRRLAIFQKKVIEIRIRVNKRQGTCVNVEGELVCVSTELHFRSDKSHHFGGASRSMMSDREVLCGTRFCPVSMRQFRNTANMQNSI